MYIWKKINRGIVKFPNEGNIVKEKVDEFERTCIESLESGNS